MTTKAELITYLKSTDQKRVVLVEIDGVVGASGTTYLSNRPYTTKPTDTPANTTYTACISGGVTFTEKIDLAGNPTLSTGDIEISNPEGFRDTWLSWIWANKVVRVLIGDASWGRADFYQIFNGLVYDLDTKSRTSLNLILVDRLQKLNVAISETVIGGTSTNKDQLKPLCFGECFNVTPLLIDAATLTYQVHTGTIERFIDVRDNGLTVGFTETLGEGKFTLTQSPYGTITASVQGSKVSGVYSGKITDIIQNILINYGKTGSITSADIDTASFSALAVSPNANAGIYITDRQNVLDVCYQLARSIGAYLVTTVDGKFKLVRVTSSPGTASAYNTVTGTDMDEATINITQRFDVQGAAKVAYCKNWTVQNSGLAAGLKPEFSALFAKDWFYKSVVDATVISNYNQSAEPPQTDTLLITDSDATTEATRINTLRKTPRYVFTATYLPHMLLTELGDPFKITHEKRYKDILYNAGAGTTGTVVEIGRDWLRGRVSIGVLI
jgi:hypothetical protein